MTHMILQDYKPSRNTAPIIIDTREVAIFGEDRVILKGGFVFEIPSYFLDSYLSQVSQIEVPTVVDIHEHGDERADYL